MVKYGEVADTENAESDLVSGLDCMVDYWRQQMYWTVTPPLELIIVT